MKIETHIDTYNTLELDKVIYHRKFQCLPDPRGMKPGCKEEEPKFDIKPQVRVNTKIYTDGEIVEAIESEPENISEYYINGIKYGQAVDTLIKKRVRVKNASYILIVTITNEIRRIGTRGFGFFDVIRNTKIFLNNPKDKTALKKARKTILEISGSRKRESIFSALFEKNNSANTLDYRKIDDNVYRLKT